MKKIIAAVAILALMAGSAYAAEWNFYGEAMVYTLWSDTDQIDGADGDTQFAEGLYDAAAIGANVIVSDELTGHFEYGAENGTADIVLLYGEWNFGSGILTVGKAFSPINVTYSNQLVAGEDNQDLTLGGFGDFDQEEIAQVKLTFDGFSIAIVDPVTDDLGGYETQAVIPMITACYKASFDMGEVQVAGAYNTFEVNDDEDVDAFGIGFGTQLNFGALGIFGTFVWAQNAAYLGTATATALEGEATYAGSGTDVNDCESIGGTVGMTFAFGEMLAIEAGYGYIHDELDDSDNSNIAQSYYLQAAITLAPGVTVTPEVGMIDERETGENETIYFGACWAISF